jgi:hypothetical protein
MSVAHACNSSYSGGRDQEDHSSKPAWAKKKKKQEPSNREALSSNPNTTSSPEKENSGVCITLVVELLPRKLEILDPIPTTTKIK